MAKRITIYFEEEDKFKDILKIFHQIERILVNKGKGSIGTLVITEEKEYDGLPKFSG
jgi:hypothetical protein